MNQAAPQHDSTRLAGPLLTAFIASGAIMLIELTAGKLISRHLGMSLYTWTSIIAVMMAGMSTGNALGGYVADRFAPRRALGVLFLLSSLTCLALLPLNDFLGHLGALKALNWPARIFLHILAMFFLPAVALGAISPVVARLALGLGGPPGRTVGFVYASSVAGSIVCTFLTGYWLVLLLGVVAIFLLAAAMLAALGVAYLVLSFRSEVPAPSRAISADLPAATSRAWTAALATVVLSNFAFMAIELAAARLLAHDYGSSIFTWTATIGVFLAGITLGNALGGWLADRDASNNVVAKYFLAAAAATLAGPFIYRIVYNALAQGAALDALGWGTRTALVMAAGFFLPCMFLGYISPLIVKRGLDAGRAPGRTVAGVYAWGAVGGVLGTLATGYFLIDWLGALRVIVIAAFLLALAGALYAGKRPLPVALLGVAAAAVLAAFVNIPPIARAAMALELRPTEYGNVIHQDESQYSYIAIKVEPENPRQRIMILDKLDHSRIDLDHPLDGKQEYEWIYRAVLDQLHPAPTPIRALILGGGGYTVPTLLDTTRPGSHVEVAEIDPAVTHAARVAFALDPSPNMEIHNIDARNRLTTLTDLRAADPTAVPPYDVIVGDTFNNFSVPAHLTTLECSQLIHDLLGPDGIYLLNLIDMYEPGSFLAAFVKTLQQVFPNVYVFNMGRPPVVRDLFVVVCANKPLDLSTIAETVHRDHFYGGHLLEPEALERLLIRNPGPILTDNYAPTDLLALPVLTRGHLAFGVEHYGLAADAAGRGELDTAINEAAAAIIGHPGWPEAYDLLGDVLAKQGKLDNAREAWRQALVYTSRPSRMYFKIGNSFLQAGDLKAAEPALNKALTADPTYVDPIFPLAALLLNQQKTTEALAILQRAVQLAPDNIATYMNLALAHTLQGDKQAALNDYQTALTLNPENATALESTLQLHLDLKQYPQAHATIDRYNDLNLPPPPALLEQLQRESAPAP